MMRINLVIAIVLFGFLTSFPVSALGAVSTETPVIKAAIPKGVPVHWFAKAKQGIVAREYHASISSHKDPAVGKALQAPNRCQNLRTWFTQSGITVQRRVGAEKSWNFKLRPLKAGVAGFLQSLIFGSPNAKDNRVTYPGEKLEQWFENRTEGLEQGFTIPKPLGTGEVLITLAVEGSLKPKLKNSITLDLLSPSGVKVLEYGNLKAIDAKNKTLPSHFSLKDSQLTIHIETSGAVYPLIVDPLLHVPSWSIPGEHDGDNFGASVQCAGDVNGDGYDDVIIGAQYYDNSEDNEGAAFLYLGSATGLAVSPAWSVEGDQEYAALGNSKPAGDINNDGYDDVLVGAGLYDDGVIDNAGIIYLYLGSDSGLAEYPSWSVAGDQEEVRLGRFSTAGDVNGDGFDDVIIGDIMYSNGAEEEGAVHLYLGSATGLAVSPAWSVEGDQEHAHFGGSVSAAGDVNGDGFDDMLVGIPYYDNGEEYVSAVCLYLGSKDIVDNDCAWFKTLGPVAGPYGVRIATAGDVNGDGYADVIIGEPVNDDSTKGVAYLYLGSTTGLAVSPAWSAEGNQEGTWFGDSVSTAGDVNNDGFDDVIVGASRYSNDENDEGAVFVYLGSADGLSRVACWMAESDQVDSGFGASASTAGDVDGDGYADVIVGSPWYVVSEIKTGAAFVYMGSTSGLAVSPSWSVEGNQENALFGHPAATAGDVNGDGFDDLIIGARWYDNGEEDVGAAFVYFGSIMGLAANPAWSAEGNQADAHFGGSVSTAGDVNGDGFDDVVVGASSYNNGEFFEGAAYVYLGSASGLAANPAWSAEGNQADAHFGGSVSTAGDINGDGFDDVVVGAWGYDNIEEDEGAIFVFPGTTKGVSANPWIRYSNQADARLSRVSSAGDINGDGFDEIAAGSTFYDYNREDNVGAVFIWFGTEKGPLDNPVVLKGNQAGAGFGGSVSPAGDVNGDGFDDVIVGASSYDNGEEDEGAAFLYAGSELGIYLTPVWMMESNHSDAMFGCLVSTAGDVNGDGFDDVIIGAWGYEDYKGAAFVYLGSTLGLAEYHSWLAVGDQTRDELVGRSTAGDVNGDGYDDVIVSASGNGYGEVLVYYGMAPVAYVSSDGRCDNHMSCYTTIGEAYLDSSVQKILIVAGVYNENLEFTRQAPIVLSGGWSDGYEIFCGATVIDGSMTISAGCLQIEGTLAIGDS